MDRNQELVQECTAEKLRVLDEFSRAAKATDRDFIKFEPEILADDLVAVYVVKRSQGKLVKLGVNVRGSSPAVMMIDIIHRTMM